MTGKLAKRGHIKELPWSAPTYHLPTHPLFQNSDLPDAHRLGDNGGKSNPEIPMPHFYIACSALGLVDGGRSVRASAGAGHRVHHGANRGAADARPRRLRRVFAARDDGPPRRARGKHRRHQGLQDPLGQGLRCRGRLDGRRGGYRHAVPGSLDQQTCRGDGRAARRAGRPVLSGRRHQLHPEVLENQAEPVDGDAAVAAQPYLGSR